MSTRVDEIPPDGWVTKLREVFGISDDATWQDILHECAQTKRHADRATKEYFAKIGPVEAATNDGSIGTGKFHPGAAETPPRPDRLDADLIQRMARQHAVDFMCAGEEPRTPYELHTVTTYTTNLLAFAGRLRAVGVSAGEKKAEK